MFWVKLVLKIGGRGETKLKLIGHGRIPAFQYFLLISPYHGDPSHPLYNEMLITGRKCT
jgi:hypothetical protein